MCDLFEMLVERLTNIEHKLDKLDKLEKLEKQITAIQQDDNFQPAGGIVSGQLHGGLPLQIRKCYETEDNMTIKADEGFKDASRKLMGIKFPNSFGSCKYPMYALHVTDFESNSEKYQKFFKYLTSRPEDREFAMAVHERISQNKVSINDKCETLGLLNHTYTRTTLADELEYRYVKAHLPFIRYMNDTLLLIDLRDMYKFHKKKTNITEEGEVTIEDCMHALSDVYKLLEIKTDRGVSKAELYILPGISADLVRAVGEKELFAVTNILKEEWRHASNPSTSIFKNMDEQVSRARTKESLVTDFCKGEWLVEHWNWIKEQVLQ